MSDQLIVRTEQQPDDVTRHAATAMNASAEGRYECPRCHSRANDAGRCAVDGAARIVFSAVRAPASWDGDVAGESGDDALNPRGLGLAYGQFVVALMFAWQGSGIWRLIAIPFLVLAMRSLWGELEEKSRRLEERRRAQRSVFTDSVHHADSIASSREGLVRIRGRVRPLPGAEDPDGFGRVLLAADDPRGDIARGAAFELVDDSGVHAVVRAAYLRLPRECKIGGRYVLAPDAEIEIAALARWETGGQDSNTNFRESARVLELYAPEGEPCEVRMLTDRAPATRASNASTQSSTRVRVSVATNESNANESEAETESNDGRPAEHARRNER